MHPTLRIRWALGGDPPREVEDRLFELLSAVEGRGSLRAAARDAGVSYRHAWGLLAGWETALGAPLARLERGRGARLTPLGERLLAVRGRVAARLAADLERLAAEAGEELGAALQAAAAPVVRIRASHSLALEVLRDLLTGADTAPRPAPQIDLQVRGSIESLRLLRRGECDLAGFHVPAGAPGRRLLPRYRRWLEPRTHALVRVVDRSQGLMLAPGNPRGIRDLGGLAGPGVRFVNRQPESGTRLLFDDLLAQAGVAPARVAGYGAEEFTHTAVAALVAGGAADAGFGIAAAAARFGLTFLPMARERYWLAARREDLDGPALVPLRKALAGRAFRDRVGRMPGYDAAGAGRVRPVEALSEPE
jgi:putative molybdopterin biosynthesis protein